MKKENLFRFWNPVEKKMIYCSTEYPDYLSKFFIEYDDALRSGYEPKLMAYIGIPDKYGNPIYKSDVVAQTPTAERYEVIFEKTAYKKRSIKNPHSKMQGLYADGYMLIGNIYEDESLTSAGKKNNI